MTDPRPTPDECPRVGTRLGHYEITAKLGEGGMGEVYRATDTKLKRQVAIKVLPAAFTEDRERLARFEREAQLLAQLQHPHIASIFGLEESDGVRALVMELVEGDDLSTLIGRGALPLAEALAIARQIAEALEAAHEHGIVHRDLKPQNIKASSEGKVKVLDFGLAKAMDPMGAASGPGSASQLAKSPTLTAGATVQGMILGTAAYMSPEQAKGRPVDRRADIWAFGVVLYEMLTGRRLFEGESVTETLASVLRETPDLERLPEEVPGAVRDLLRRCLTKDPRQRLQSIGDARVVLEEALAASANAGESLAQAPTSAPLPGRVWALLALASIASLGVGWLLGAGVGSPSGTRSNDLPQFQFRKLTFLPGMEWSPELSADGKTLLFASGGDDRGDLYSVPVGGKRPIALTADSPSFNGSPRISPDGTRVAFSSSRDGGGLFVMGVNGESVRRLAASGFNPAWSPDGRSIVSSTVSIFLPTDRGEKGKLQIVDVASGEIRTLETGDAVQPSWSPSGGRIAYWGVRGDGGDREVWTVAATGGAPVDVASDPALDWNPVWSEDGRFLYFLSDRGGAMNLWRVPIDEGTGEVLGAAESVPFPADEMIYLSRTGKRWVYAAFSARSAIRRWRFDPERSVLVGASEAVLSTTSNLLTMQPSPDGKLLVYSTQSPQQDLYLVPAAGGTPTQLTDDPERDRWPSWAPDGKRILFMSQRGARYETWGVRPDGSGLQAMTRTAAEPMWLPILSPDGSRLAVTSEKSVSIFDASGPPPWEKFERVQPPPESAGRRFRAEDWSPNGSFLAGTLTSDTEPSGLALYDLEARTLRVLGQPAIPVGWYPDGRRLLIKIDDKLETLDLGTWRSTPIPSSPQFASRVEASSDLTELYFLENDRQSDIWLAEERVSK